MKMLESVVRKVLDDIAYSFQKKDDGTYCFEIYADYRDEMDTKTAIEILESLNPMGAFWDWLIDSYDETEYGELCELIRRVKAQLDPFFPEGLDDEEEIEAEELVRDLCSWEYPEDHFLDQEFPVTIMLDTGDGNFDYTLNCPYPHYAGDYDRRLDEKSSLLWLARQQGYTKTQLWQALRKGDLADPKGFLESCRVEVANSASQMQTVTFLVKMTLRDLMLLNRCIRLQDRDGRNYDATKNPYCGYIVLDKETMCGLYDPWSGGGSVLEVELEKDVRIPIRFVRSALPDGGDGYGIGDVYGMCDFAWKDSLKAIHAPKNITELEATMANKPAA